MAKVNIPDRPPILTHEGGTGHRINDKQQLKRSVLACLLWERQFYECGVSIAERIWQLTQKVAKSDLPFVERLACDARSVHNLRHVPLLILCALAEDGKLRKELVESVIQRADELTEVLAIYWLGGRKPISAQLKKGLALAFPKFDAYQLAKYDREGSVKLRDVLFLCHPKPRDSEQEAVWKKLIDGQLEPPDTWEVALSRGDDKKATWERLLAEKRLGYMALLRNLRNMHNVGVGEHQVFSALMDGAVRSRVLPFRFLAAAMTNPYWESEIEQAMLASLDGAEKLPGLTHLVVDVSASMECSTLSNRSDLNHMQAACALAILCREVCEQVRVWTFSDREVEVAARRGFALGDAIIGSQRHSGTYLEKSLRNIRDHYLQLPSELGDRIIVITDEQAHDGICEPWTERAYVINVASYKNGVGYGRWTHIDGFSEAVIAYINEIEKETETS